MSQKDRYQKEKKQKSHQLNESKLRWKNHEFVGLRAKTYSYLTNDNDENKKKTKATKKCIIKKNKSEGYKNYLQVSQLELLRWERMHTEQARISYV